MISQSSGAIRVGCLLNSSTKNNPPTPLKPPRGSCSKYQWVKGWVKRIHGKNLVLPALEEVGEGGAQSEVLIKYCHL